MANIGNLGSTIVFSTSDKKILNFNSFEQTVSGKWATHDRIMKKPVSEFLGPDKRKVTFKIILSALHGVKPRKTLQAIHTMVEKGTAEPLVIGGGKIGAYKWVISSVSETWDIIMDKGELVKATASITLEEYL